MERELRVIHKQGVLPGRDRVLDWGRGSILVYFMSLVDNCRVAEYH
jgi:hypothetical protein